MTKDELITELKYIAENLEKSMNKQLPFDHPDFLTISDAHETADYIILKYIDDDEVTAAYESIEPMFYG